MLTKRPSAAGSYVCITGTVKPDSEAHVLQTATLEKPVDGVV